MDDKQLPSGPFGAPARPLRVNEEPLGRHLERVQRHQATAREVVDAFLGGRRETTKRAYLQDFAAFASWLEVKSLESAAEILTAHEFENAPSNAIALKYKNFMIESGRYVNSTINRRLTALRNVVKFARTIGKIKWALDVENVKVETYSDTRGTGVDGYRKLLAELDRRKDTPAVRRDKAIVTLLFSLALRRKEVHGLDYSDIEFDKDRIWILGKGKDARECVSLTKSATAAIKRYLELRGKDNGPLFMSYDPAYKGDGRLSLRSISRLVRKLGIVAGVSGARPHGLRHASITAALDRLDGDVRRVMKFSRHKQIQTVLIYDDNRTDIGGQVANELDESIFGTDEEKIE